MTSLDAFSVAWTKARTTLGIGAPETGEWLDKAENGVRLDGTRADYPSIGAYQNVPAPLPWTELRLTSDPPRVPSAAPSRVEHI